MQKIIVVLGIFLSVHGVTQNLNLDSIYLIVEGKGIANLVSLGETKKGVIKKFGKPDKFHFTKNIGRIHSGRKKKYTNLRVDFFGRSKTFYYYEKLEILVSFNKKKKVKSITIYGENYKTKNGIQVGQHPNIIFKLYNSELWDCDSLFIPGLIVYYDCIEINKIIIKKE